MCEALVSRVEYINCYKFTTFFEYIKMWLRETSAKETCCPFLFVNVTTEGQSMHTGMTNLFIFVIQTCGTCHRAITGRDKERIIQRT